ncbi:hypothetical protein E2C01_072024 [Portunus trituberculatus]|uniref:Uncharacterized protein n=1 Tax=Portunus trituberculatus TaxID=210409 RepID=A0A5B7I7U9_PORTR|nr:hypothetical protein [Portunus trituberculatus]
MNSCRGVASHRDFVDMDPTEIVNCMADQDTDPLPAPSATTASPSSSNSSSAKSTSTSTKTFTAITSSAPYLSVISRTPSKDE